MLAWLSGHLVPWYRRTLWEVRSHQGSTRRLYILSTWPVGSVCVLAESLRLHTLGLPKENDILHISIIQCTRTPKGSGYSWVRRTSPSRKFRGSSTLVRTNPSLPRICLCHKRKKKKTPKTQLQGVVSETVSHTKLSGHQQYFQQ